MGALHRQPGKPPLSGSLSRAPACCAGTCVACRHTHLEMEPGRRASCGFHQHTILLPGPEHEPQVPRHRDGDVEVTP